MGHDVALARGGRAEGARRRLRVAARLASLQPAALTELGHLLETLVVGEILKQASWSDGVAGCGHWRTHDGDEIDLVLERDDGSVVAFEVKAGGRVVGSSVSGLRKLRNALGRQFCGGVVLYTGERSYTLEDRIHVLPIDRLWTPAPVSCGSRCCTTRGDRTPGSGRTSRASVRATRESR